MAGFTDYLENKVLIHVFGGTAYTAPSTLYVGLFTAVPSDTGGGTECSGGSYARKSMADMTVSGTSPTQATNGANFGDGDEFARYQILKEFTIATNEIRCKADNQAGNPSIFCGINDLLYQWFKQREQSL